MEKKKRKKLCSHNQFSSIQALSCIQLCDPIYCSTPGFPVHHHLRACSNSCPSSQCCHPTFSSSAIPSSFLQCCPASGFFQWVCSSYQVVKVLELQLQHQSFQWIFRTDFLWDGLVGSPCSPRSHWTNLFSWQNSISLCPVSFCTPRPNLSVTPGVSWLPTFAFQSPIMKKTSFEGVSSRRSCRSS